MAPIDDILQNLRAAASRLMAEAGRGAPLIAVLEDVGHALLALDDLDSAEPLVQEALRRRPGSARARLSAVMLDLRRGRLEEALANAVEGMRRHPRDRVFVHKRATALQRLDRHSDAMDILGKWLQTNYNDFSARLALAASARRLNRFDEAERQCEAVLKMQPAHRAAHLGLVLSALGRQDPAAAVSRAEAALEMVPGDWAIRERLAQAQERDGRHGAAVGTLTDLLAERPGDTDLRLRLASAQRRNGDPDAACETLDALLESDPSHAEALTTRLELALIDPDPLVATRLAADAARNYPEHARLIHKAAIAWRRSGDPSAAANSLRRCLEKNPGAMTLQIELGRCLLMLGEIDEAAGLFDEALKKAPANVGARLGLADAQIASGNDAAALATLEEAIPAMDAPQHG